MKNPHFILLGLIVLYIIVRMLVVSSQIDDIFDVHEFFSGTLAFELIHGLSLPLKYCIPDDHNFGSIVNGILIVPFYLLFGSSAVSAKMVSILFSLGVLIFSYLLLNRFFNRRAAVIASLLFIFSPTIYTKSSVLSIGSHPESNLFTLIILFILYLIFFDNRKTATYFIMLGLTAGFGLFYSYICGIALPVVLLCWFAFDRKFILKPQFYIFLLFFIIGFSPRCYFSGGIEPALERVSFFLQDAFNLHGIFSLRTILKAKAFFLEDLPRLFIFEHRPRFMQYIYCSFFLSSFLYLLWYSTRSVIPQKNKKKIIANESLILMMPSFFSLAYILSNYAIWGGWVCAGYLVPLYSFIFILTALFFERMIRVQSKLLKVFFLAILGFILLTGVHENLSLISFTNIDRGFIVKGYSYRLFGQYIGRNYNVKNDAKFLKYLKNIDFSKRQYFLTGLGYYQGMFYACYYKNKELVKDSSVELFLSAQEMPAFYKGFGIGLAEHLIYNVDLRRDLPYDSESVLLILREFIGKKNHDINKSLWEGFGFGCMDKSLDSINFIIKYSLENRFKPYFYKGIGESMGLHRASKRYMAGFLNGIALEYRQYALSGYEETSSEMFSKE